MRLYKFYTWSVVLEPLLFFTGLGVTTGIGVSLARGLQLIFIFLYFMALLTKPIYSLRDSFFRSSLSRLKNHYWAFLFVSLTGSSLVFLFNQFTNNPFFKIVTWPGETALLRHAYVRPFFEIIIYLFYFWYFVILPHKILKKIEHLKYFFKVFSFVFILNLFLGYADIIGSWVNRPIIPRHLIESLMGSIVFVGPRFHGLAGEPRDAFVYLSLGLAVYLLATGVFKRKVNYWYIMIMLFALVLTQSVSGVLGIFLFVLLALCLGACSGYLKSRHLIVISVISFVIIIASLYFGARITAQIENIQSLFRNFDTLQVPQGVEVAPMLIGQLVNIVPLLHFLKELMSFNLFPILFGHGIESHSMINNFVKIAMGWGSELQNSHAQIVRLIYDFGIVGTFLYVLSMVRPIVLLNTKVRHLNINTKLIVIAMLFVLGSGLAQRSAAPYIFLGITHVSLLILKVSNEPNTSANDLFSKVEAKKIT